MQKYKKIKIKYNEVTGVYNIYLNDNAVKGKIQKLKALSWASQKCYIDTKCNNFYYNFTVIRNNYNDFMNIARGLKQ